MAIDVSNLNEIRTRVLVGSAPQGEFGRGLVLTTDAAIAAGGSGKGRLFDSLADAEAVLSAGPALSEVTTWFAQGAAHGIYVGRWATADVATTLTSGAPGALGDLQAANASFVINGSTVTVNTSGAASLTAVASAIQTALQAVSGFSGATFVFANNRFVLTLANADAIAGGALTEAATGTAVAAGLGMAATSTDRIYLLGHDQESAVAAVQEIFDSAAAQRPDVVFLATDAPTTDPVTTRDTRADLSEYAETSNRFVFLALDNAAQTLVPNDSTSLAALTLAAVRGNTAFSYGPLDSRLAAGLGGFLSAQDFEQPDSIESAHSKTLTGVTVAPITDTQLNELERKRTNVYVTVGAEPSLLGGYTSRNAYWLDNVWWLRWFRRQIQARVWAAQKGSKRFTTGRLYDALLAVAQEGVRSGGIEPGREASAAMRSDIIGVTGDRAFTGRMENGYVIWVNNDRTEAQVDARQGQFKLWATGTAALHYIDGEIAFQN